MPISEFLEASMVESLTVLQNHLTVTTTPRGDNTHSVVEVTGWQSDEVVSALAMYLVVLRSSVINQAIEICTELIDDPPSFADSLIRSVNEIIDQPPDSEEPPADWKSKWRNPWIAEGVWHCCMRVAMDKPEIHEHGTIIAIDLPHISPKDHGFDVTALYVTGADELGLSFVESKAYRNDPNKAISDASAMLKAIEAGEYDTRLRQMITSFRSTIAEQYRPKLSSSLWKNERTLIPNPHYEANGANVQWARRRVVFNNLSAPVVIMPHGVDGFDTFFDNVAEGMRRYAQEVMAHV